MKKIWKIVGIIALAAIILGAVFIGVGLITNADTGRIYSVLDNRYHITMYVEYVQEVVRIVLAELAA